MIITEKPKPVVFVIPKMYLAGAERVLYEIVSSLDRKKYSLHVICFYKTESTFVFDSEIKIHYLFPDFKNADKKNSLTKVMNLVRGGLISLKLTQYLSKFPRGTIIIPFIEYNAIKTVLAKILYGHRIISRPASTGFAYIQYHFKRSWRQQLEKWFLKFDFLCADKIIVQSDGVRLDLIEKINVPEKKIVRIYNPINLDEIKKLKNETLDIDLLKKENTTYFSHVGRLVKKKNHRLLIDAAVLLKKKYSDFVILCAGAGPLELQIKHWIGEYHLENNIIMIGELDNPFALMKETRALINTSQHESFSIVLVEAMASGSTVISTNCPYGPAEVLDDGKYGILVPMNHPRALADAMIEITKNEKYFKYLKKKTIKRASEYNVNLIVKKWEILLDCCKNKG